MKILERLKHEQIKAGQTIQLSYEPGKIIEVKKTGSVFQVILSNEKRLLLNDEVKFKLLELHYRLHLTHVFRQGNSIGQMQLAKVSGVTSIKRV